MVATNDDRHVHNVYTIGRWARNKGMPLFLFILIAPSSFSHAVREDGERENQEIKKKKSGYHYIRPVVRLNQRKKER